MALQEWSAGVVRGAASASGWANFNFGRCERWGGMWNSSGLGHWEPEPTGAFSLYVHILPMATKVCLVSGAHPVQEFLAFPSLVEKLW